MFARLIQRHYWHLLATGLFTILLFTSSPAENAIDPVSELCNAIRYRKWEEAMRLVKSGADVNGLSNQQERPLAILTECFNSTNAQANSLLLELLDRGADPFIAARTTMYGRGDHAIIEGTLFNRSDFVLCDILLTNHLNTARRTPFGDTAFHLAIRAGRTNVIDVLLSNGFQIDQTNSRGFTSLKAIIGDALKGAFILTNSQAPRFFHYASKGRVHENTPGDMVDFLLSRGATLDIWCAAGLGMTNELAHYLEKNPELKNARDNVGWTPLHYAVGNDQSNVVRKLLAAGANPNLQTTEELRNYHVTPIATTPLHLAANRDNEAMAELLLAGGADPTQRDANGNTPLHLAVRWGQFASGLMIPDSTLNATNLAGKTPLRIAVEAGSMDNITALCRAGARVDVNAEEGSLLHIAALVGSGAYDMMPAQMGAQAIDSLLRQGFKVDARDGKGRTALHLAATSLNLQAMQRLIEDHADPNARDRDGNTPLHHLAILSYDQLWQDPFLVPRTIPRSTNQQVRLSGEQVGIPPLPSINATGWLIDHGANPDVTNNLGQTALDLVCNHKWGYGDTNAVTNRIAILLKAGAIAKNLTPAGSNLLQKINAPK